MKRLSVLVVGLLVIGCSGQGQRPARSPASTVPDDGKWFCQMEPSGASWECVQDPRLAENPQPTRLPQPPRQETPDTAPPPAMLPDDELLPLGEAPLPGSPPRRPEEEPPPPAPESLPQEPPRPSAPDDPPPAAGTPLPEAAAAVPEAEGATLPEYARLAYQPPQPVPLSDLPPAFYAVQLVAMSTKDALEALAAREHIRGMSAARVESNGKLYFVLLLGIYESREIAERAVAAMPPMEGTEPWIRRLGSLQSAMRRADRMTGDTRF